MELSLRQYLLAGTILAGGAIVGGATPTAAAVCPLVGYDSTPGCALVINLPASGPATISNGPWAGHPFDGSDDTLIGVTNNSGTTITSIHLSSTLDIGDFEGDGIGENPNGTSGLAGLWAANGVATPVGENTNASHGPTYSGTDSTTGSFNLSGPLNFFTNDLGTSVTLNFPGGLAPGGSAFFSLEEPLTAASFTVAPPVSTPEPATLSIVGAALAGFGLLRRRRKT
jgi:PEP-CTERM motif